MQPGLPLRRPTLVASPVSILIRPEGRMQLQGCRTAQRPATVVVSILIRPEGRMQPVDGGRSSKPDCVPIVSILIRPEGRMQPGLPIHALANACKPFQSSSGQKAGCNTWHHEGQVSVVSRFQSSSGQKAGCNDVLARLVVEVVPWSFNPHPARRPVSIQSSTSAFWPELQSSSGQKAGCNTARPLITPVAQFQSSSGQKAGCNPLAAVVTSELGRLALGFNPHPARRPDATPWPGRPRSLLGLKRFQSSSGQKAGCNLPEQAHAERDRNLFQSSSGQKAGCNCAPAEGLVTAWRAVPLFQSSSGQKAGCNAASPWCVSMRGPGTCFNPHPARRPDATLGLRRRLNPHPAQKAGATVSFRYVHYVRPCFNPHPARRPDATTFLKLRLWTSTPVLSVSILIRPEGRMQPGSFLTGVQDCGST